MIDDMCIIVRLIVLLCHSECSNLSLLLPHKWTNHFIQYEFPPTYDFKNNEREPTCTSHVSEYNCHYHIQVYASFVSPRTSYWLLALSLVFCFLWTTWLNHIPVIHWFCLVIQWVEETGGVYNGQVRIQTRAIDAIKRDFWFNPSYVR